MRTRMRPEEVASWFNEAINRADLNALGALMTDDHVFTDSVGAQVVGKVNCVEAWRGFFAQFPDYRNHFVQVVAQGNRVAISGWSTCSVAVLDGPALWLAETRDDRVTHWRVYADAPETRAELGLQPDSPCNVNRLAAR